MAHDLKELNEISVCIIDPVSPEFNRGSFCYTPYLLRAGLPNSVLFENYNAADIDRIPDDYDLYLIALWSHPQIEQVLTFLRFLPKEKTRVFGYTPLAHYYDMPVFTIPDALLIAGMVNYVKMQDSFSHILLSDCDMHLKKFKGQVYPMFTSYGCPNQCSFCPSSANHPRRTEMHLKDVEVNIEYMHTMGKNSIHFTDEDLFYDTDRAFEICQMLIKYNAGWQLIALAERRTLTKFILKYGTEVLERAGFKLLEVGLESADISLAKDMGKSGPETAQELSEACSVPILWLTITFFPGETIKTLRTTGQFLEKYGQEYDDLYPRIVTNGTAGGLGQFFQIYEGTRGYEKAHQEGMCISPRPLRLIPSYIPFSFMSDKIRKCRLTIPGDQIKWYELYRVQPPCGYPMQGMTIKEAAEEFWPDPIKGYISLAISAKLGVII